MVYILDFSLKKKKKHFLKVISPKEPLFQQLDKSAESQLIKIPLCGVFIHVLCDFTFPFP